MPTRDLPGVMSTGDMLGRGEPVYRFRGRVRPDETVRASVLEAGMEGTVATMRLYDPIDSWGDIWGVSAKEFAASLDALPAGTTEIRLHINSPGGEVWEAIAMANQLRNHPARVVAIIDGLAASAASLLACIADELVMGRNSQLMIHDAWGVAIGPAATMTDAAARLDKSSNNMAGIYADKAGGSVEDWRAAMLAETWYDAQEAVDVGLADSVDEAAQASAPLSSFDLSIFRNAASSAPAEAPPVVPAPEAAADDDEPAKSGPSAFQVRRHRMNARRRLSA